VYVEAKTLTVTVSHGDLVWLFIMISQVVVLSTRGTMESQSPQVGLKFVLLRICHSFSPMIVRDNSSSALDSRLLVSILRSLEGALRVTLGCHLGNP
jgi:hypothetical protein